MYIIFKFSLRLQRLQSEAMSDFVWGGGGGITDFLLYTS